MDAGVCLSRNLLGLKVCERRALECGVCVEGGYLWVACASGCECVWRYKQSLFYLKTPLQHIDFHILDSGMSKIWPF